MERKLDNLGEALNENLLSVYIATAQRFIAAMRKVNDYYLTHYDNRGRAIEEHITQLVHDFTHQISSSDVMQNEEDEEEEPIETQSNETLLKKGDASLLLFKTVFPRDTNR